MGEFLTGKIPRSLLRGIFNPRIQKHSGALTAQRIAGVFLLLALCTLQPRTAVADIYMYRDSNGVLHFTNVPTSPKFQVYIRERVARSRRRFDPNRYDHLISRASKHHGVDFPLLKAIIKVESDFNPKAVSKRGAMGLMQIMPDNVKRLKIRDPFDPWENIMGGARFFKKMMRRYRGTTQLALAAYNAGPQAVDRYASIPPYPETREYVKRVLEYYRFFKKG